MKVGQAAQLVGVESHVLRHWEDVGVVVPERDDANHRRYNDETVHRLRMVLACQSAGMSLDQIKKILHRNAAGRREVINEQRNALAQQRLLLEETERFLEHVLSCKHDLVTRCSECSCYPNANFPLD